MINRSNYSMFQLLYIFLTGVLPSVCWAWLALPASRTPRSTTHLHNAKCLSQDQLRELNNKKYLIVPNFISESLQKSLRHDVELLRSQNYFKVAKIGQDSTNTLNTDIRVAETCFLGRSKKDLPAHAGRQELYERLESLRADLELSGPLSDQLTELLYAYYPQGGFYRRHRDAIPGSASFLRAYSILLYLNRDWDSSTDAGQLRLHFDSGGDELPAGENPFYQDVDPEGGTLVIFQSEAIPHEVLNTQRERVAVVGWFNRPMLASDIATISEKSPLQMILLSVSAALVTVGIFGVFS